MNRATEIPKAKELSLNDVFGRMYSGLPDMAQVLGYLMRGPVSIRDAGYRNI